MAADRRRNGGQEFGEVKAQVASLAETLHDFRDETRKALGEMKQEFSRALREHANEDRAAHARISKLESARTFWQGRVAGIVGTLSTLTIGVYGLIQLIALFAKK